MQIIERIERVGPDGTLSVTIPVGSDAANQNVKITIEPLEPSTRRPPTPEEWQQFIRETAGSIPDPTFRRWLEGDFEQRETFR